MTLYFLYVKTHNKTGLKYLGYTTQDPMLYKGSGVYWMKHLKIHGADISTDVLMTFSCTSALKHWGVYYSDLWDVVNNPVWANLKREEGDGGRMSDTSLDIVRKKLTGRKKSEEHRKKLKGNNKGRKHSPEANALKGRPGELNGMYGRKRTEDEKDKIRRTRALRTPEQNKKSYSRVKSQEEIEKTKKTKADRREERLGQRS
jgi:hypothetical protein